MSLNDTKSGIQFPEVIDLIAQDPQTGSVILAMFENRPWTGDEHQLYELQEKCNTYLSFALDGEMSENYPNLANKPIILQLKTEFPPDTKTNAFLDLLRGALPASVTLEVWQGIPNPDLPQSQSENPSIV